MAAFAIITNAWGLVNYSLSIVTECSNILFSIAWAKTEIVTNILIIIFSALDESFIHHNILGPICKITQRNKEHI